MRPNLPLAALLATLAALLAAPGEASGAPVWRWPVKGDITRPFETTTNRFAAGQHRGIDIAARPGAEVRAACTGRVTFAGRTPNHDRGVTIACGTLAATHLHLATTTVKTGDLVAAGDRVGEAAGRAVQLGARRREDRFGYIDPLRLLGPDPSPPLGAAPVGRRPPQGATRGPRAARPQRTPTTEIAPATTRPSPILLAGLALFLAGLPAGGLVAARRRRTAARGAAQASA